MQIDYSTDDMAEAIETVLQALDNSIPIQVVEEKIKELKIKKKKYGFGSIESIIFLNKIQVLQQLLETFQKK